MPKECCGYFPHPLDVYEARNEVLGPSDIVAETRAKNCSQPFCNHLKEKDWKLPSASMTLNAMFRGIILYIFLK